MEVQGSLGRQIQGISQQPASVRLPGQCTDAINCSMDVVEGTKSRPGTVHIARLGDLGLIQDNTNIHHYRRGDDVEEYWMITNPLGIPDIFDKQGRKCTVTETEGAASYFNSNNPRVDYKFFTVGDTTFVVNRTKIVRARADKTPAVGGTALVFSAYGQYGTNYQIIINGVKAAEYKTASGGSASDVETIRTEVIAEQLYTKLLAWAGVSDYTVSRLGTTIVINRNDGANFTVDTEDGSKGKDLVAIQYRVTSTDLLPSKAPVGYLVQVWPTGSKPESRYWLKAEAADGNLVTWQETLGADEVLGFDGTTMPYIIERTNIVGGIAQFTIKQGYWDDRAVGDELTNPMPSFIDQSLSDIFMVQNRLCLAAGESCIMSRTSYFFQFFRQTVLSAVDTDPIDVFADASEVYALKHAKVLDGDTVLFSDNAQFILPGDKPLTKATALLRPTTTFEVDTNVAPVVTGEAVMFATKDGAYSNIREFYTDSYSDTKKAQPVTSHVNKLIRGGIYHMASSTNFNRLFALSEDNRSRVFVYDWLWQGTDKVQSAWHKWEFYGATIGGLYYSGETLYLIIKRNDGVFLEAMYMGDPLLSGSDQVRMDRTVTVSLTWDEATLSWKSSPLPWVPTQVEMLEAVLTNGDPAYLGGAFLFEYDSNTRILSTKYGLGDTSQIWAAKVGQMYKVEFVPTDVIIRDSQDRVSYQDVPVIGLVHLNLDRYPDFTVEITNRKSGAVRVARASNRIGGARNNVVGYVKPTSGTFSFPLRALSTDVEYRIISISPHTFQLRDIEWSGSYNPTRKRV